MLPVVIMVAPKGPGSEVRSEYVRGFGMPCLIAVHPENDPEGKGWDYAKAYAAGLHADRPGVLESSFVAEVKSDLMGEQTILCGMLQTGTILCYDKMVKDFGVEPAYAVKLLQYGWETISEALKHGGITNMMDRLPENRCPLDHNGRRRTLVPHRRTDGLSGQVGEGIDVFRKRLAFSREISYISFQIGWQGTHLRKKEGPN